MPPQLLLLLKLLSAIVRAAPGPMSARATATSRAVGATGGGYRPGSRGAARLDDEPVQAGRRQTLISRLSALISSLEKSSSKSVAPPYLS